uniref:Endonuclease-like protein n=1 Tax=Myoviridae sp. ctCo31 TaxID=2825053 RepID=A0A8S5ULX2_9CAUD|nr:MAG TPA: endonuclease-like protein [Myoviridae sp. ctCo31]
MNGLELDFYIPEKNLAIEFNGDYWHSTSIDDDINQQLKKTNLCEQQGIHLIHIWEHEWLNNQEFIKELLKLYIEDKVH